MTGQHRVARLAEPARSTRRSIEEHDEREPEEASLDPSGDHGATVPKKKPPGIRGRMSGGTRTGVRGSGMARRLRGWDAAGSRVETLGWMCRDETNVTASRF